MKEARNNPEKRLAHSQVYMYVSMQRTLEKGILRKIVYL